MLSGAGAMRHRVAAAVALLFSLLAGQARAGGPPSDGSTYAAVVGQYCTGCHRLPDAAGGMDLQSLVQQPAAQAPATWERVVKKLAGRQMPPPGVPRPDDSAYRSALVSLTEELDRSAAAHPWPGRTDTFRRLNRTEYGNAVRDLLALNIDVESLLPADEASHGFDNVTVGDLPPLLLERYVSAAERISRLAMGTTGTLPNADTIRVQPDLTQEEHLAGLPIGTRGGVQVPYTFPVDGEYEISVRLARDRNEDIEGLRREHELELLVDRSRVALLAIKPPPRADDHRNADSHLRARVPVSAGPHAVAATFIKDPSVLLETQRQPYQAHFNFYRHPRTQPAVYSLTIVGPLSSSGQGSTPSRDRILACRPEPQAEDDSCAVTILRTLATRAFRRPVTESDLSGPLRLYRAGLNQPGGGFETGIERALAAILVSPSFLFRVERDPPGIPGGTPYRVSPLELASRLSFFLWSSIPDDRLREAAVQGELASPGGLERQVRRMLADPRSDSLVDNFASQWLHLRNLAATRPDMRAFPDFDDNLRQAFLQETRLLLREVLREDRSLMELLDADYTFVNERLAKHYDIPNIYGSRFRRVDLEEGSKRGGLLRHGSVLTVTSYATRTSPVLRGKWILENVLGMPPPPPPAGVPELEESTVSGSLSVRERLAEHRANPACAGCHNPMDPLGFALENYDAVGRWRDHDGEQPVDASGLLADGSKVNGVADLERALLNRPELFATAVAEKLLTFALGRGVESTDAPAIRKAVHSATDADYRVSALVLGIVESVPFQMRRSK